MDNCKNQDDNVGEIQFDGNPASMVDNIQTEVIEVIGDLDGDLGCMEESGDHEDTDELASTPKIASKKRGRKPKGGKIIQKMNCLAESNDIKPNIILHLKCSIKDLYKKNDTNSIESFNFSCKNDLSYQILNNEEEENETSDKNFVYNYVVKNDYGEYLENRDSYDNKIKDFIREERVKNIIESSEPCQVNQKEIHKKLKQLEHNLHINNISDKNSACFWCTFDFDNSPIYIPKHYIKDTYHVYGCFCSPECATAFLMEENIDSSTKFERYHLINHIYSKIYGYEKNIKPAPNPYYMLNKYYGNLNIQEYRSLLRNERLFFIVDKPLTRILPELHEDNDEFVINNKIIPSNSNYQIKKKLIKKPQCQETRENKTINEPFFAQP